MMSHQNYKACIEECMLKLYVSLVRKFVVKWPLNLAKCSSKRMNLRRSFLRNRSSVTERAPF